MSYQRRFPSRKIEQEKRNYEKNIKIEISGSKIKQKDSLKTLGVLLDDRLSFRKHWEVVVKSCWGRVFGISSLSRHLSLEKRRELGQGLVVSKLTYCLEATSTGPRSVLSSPIKTMFTLKKPTEVEDLRLI